MVVFTPNWAISSVVEEAKEPSVPEVDRVKSALALVRVIVVEEAVPIASAAYLVCFSDWHC